MADSKDLEALLAELKGLLEVPASLPEDFEAAVIRVSRAAHAARQFRENVRALGADQQHAYLRAASRIVRAAHRAWEASRKPVADFPSALDALQSDALAAQARQYLEGRLRPIAAMLRPQGLPPSYRAFLQETYAHQGKGQLILAARRSGVSGLDERLKRLLAPLSLKPHRFGGLPFAAVDCAAEEAFSLAARISGPDILCRPAHVYHIPPYCRAARDEDWNLALIQAQRAWELTQGVGAVVAVIDTGADYTHPALAERFGKMKGYNVVADTDDPMDDNEHGTHCSGIVARAGHGVAPGVRLLAVKVLDASGMGLEGDIAKGIEWAVEAKADVLSMSFGGPYTSKLTESLCGRAANAGAVLCAAAGNDGTWGYEYPASYEGVLSVAAIDRAGRRADFSQQNDEIDLCAPGVDILSTVPGGHYAAFSGTSMATPHVAGAAALLKAYAHPHADAVEEAFLATGSKLGEPTDYGVGGLIQARDALDMFVGESPERALLRRIKEFVGAST